LSKLKLIDAKAMSGWVLEKFAGKEAVPFTDTQMGGLLPLHTKKQKYQHGL
jgi:hypothetical protein